MRMKMISDKRTLYDAAIEFLSFKKAQKVRNRTLSDYEKYIFPFVKQSHNTFMKLTQQVRSIFSSREYVAVNLL